VPRLIRYYLGEDAVLPNVPTYLCREPKDLAYVVDHLDELVVKPVAEAGGYGLVIGPHATDAELEQVRQQIMADPRNYIAQELVNLSRHPCLVGDHLEGRHVDLRPFVLSGQQVEVVPGGLTRVALRKGSLVVNSSQGGGSKDTWVLAPDVVDAADDGAEATAVPEGDAPSPAVAASTSVAGGERRAQSAGVR
jgi:uncharacterized circularly permuted ATP-grasp superfamily protein